MFAGVQVFTGVCGWVQVYTDMHGCVPVCLRVCAGGVRVYVVVPGCMRVYTGKLV